MDGWTTNGRTADPRAYSLRPRIFDGGGRWSGDVLNSGRGTTGDDSRRWRWLYRQAVRAVHARLHGHELRAEHQLLLLRRASLRDAVLPLPSSLESLQMRPVGRRRRDTGVRALIVVRLTSSHLQFLTWFKIDWLIE